MKDHTKINEKLDSLKKQLKSMGSAAVAFSGGVDSTFLLKIAADVLKDNVIAVTVESPSFPKREMDLAAETADILKVRHILVESNEMDNDQFLKNDVMRCYFCKKEAFGKILEIAKENKIAFVLDGQNYDDISDYRPGAKASEELGIKSPLKENGLTKNEIRLLLKEMGLKTWSRPSFACLASRVPYGTRITEELLLIIDCLEMFLIDKGFSQVRVRHHGNLARIEVLREELSILFEKGVMEEIVSEFKRSGYFYITLDLEGYRTGSMNIMNSKTINKKQ